MTALIVLYKVREIGNWWIVIRIVILLLKLYFDPILVFYLLLISSNYFQGNSISKLSFFLIVAIPAQKQYVLDSEFGRWT